jgi:two-component system, cell cycle response regulator CpdR
MPSPPGRASDGADRRKWCLFAAQLSRRRFRAERAGAPAGSATRLWTAGLVRPCLPHIYPKTRLWNHFRLETRRPDVRPRGQPRPERAMNRILLAEDDNDMRRFLAKALNNAGYDVVSFDNGKSAYERLREEPFTLLLTDIVMPEMDGIELARRATELDPDLKIMFITGFAAVALNPDSQAPKDAKVLSKPFHLKDLVREVEKMLAAA